MTDFGDYLKPCPFCSSKATATVCREDDHERYGQVSCQNCSASTRGEYLHWADNTDAELVSMYNTIVSWNTRVPLEGQD